MSVLKYQKRFQIDWTDMTRKFTQKKKKLREKLDNGKKMLVLTERIKNKSATGKFTKQTLKNISYFSKENIFIITNKRDIEKNKTII